MITVIFQTKVLDLSQVFFKFRRNLTRLLSSWTAKEFVRLVWSLDSRNITVGLFLKRFHLFIRKIWKICRQKQPSHHRIHSQKRRVRKKKWVLFFSLSCKFTFLLQIVYMFQFLRIVKECKNDVSSIVGQASAIITELEKDNVSRVIYS